jgi:hypothetical protein
MRITKAEYVKRGGMRNPRLYRGQRGGRWYYYEAEE